MNVHTCNRCGWETKAPDHVIQVWHPCHRSGRREQLDWRTPRQRVDETRGEWARTLLGPIAQSLEDQVGADAWYQDEEE